MSLSRSSRSAARVPTICTRSICSGPPHHLKALSIDAEKNHDKPDAQTPKTAFTIEPHCEAVAYFGISTTAWLFFTPTRQSLSTQVRYRINGKEKTQITSSDFEVKPPL